MKKYLPLLCVPLLCLAMSMSACSWMGRTAGKAQAKIERGANSMEQGYNQGYKDEKAKESGQKSGSSSASTS